MPCRDGGIAWPPRPVEGQTAGVSGRSTQGWPVPVSNSRPQSCPVAEWVSKAGSPFVRAEALGAQENVGMGGSRARRLLCSSSEPGAPHASPSTPSSKLLSSYSFIGVDFFFSLPNILNIKKKKAKSPNPNTIKSKDMRKNNKG